MNKNASTDVVLGIYVTPNTIEAVLLEQGEGKARVVHRFIRPRVRRGEGGGASGNFETVLPGLKGSDESDYTIEVGDGNAGGGSSFLPSEFGDLPAGEDAGVPAAGSPAEAPFAKQLREILAECSNLGYPHPRLAFCVGPPDVSYVELTTPVREEEKAGGKSWLGGGASGSAAPGPARAALLEQLRAAHSGAFDPERVAFVPLAAPGEAPAGGPASGPAGGPARHLAIVPANSDAVTATLDELRAAPSGPAPAARLMDAEASLYLDTLRTLHPLEAEQNTALVRVGAKDTLVLFLAGTRLQHGERLRSLTASETPETVCSRVLLQQDEQKIGALHNIFVLGTGRDERLMEGFREFYPDAAVQALPQLLNEEALAASEEQALTPGAVPAASVALRLLDARRPAPEGVPLAGVNLLPQRLLRKRRSWHRIAWHSVAMLIVLLTVSGFFTWRYLEGEKRIENYKEEMHSNPVELTAAPAVVQARVDSLQNAHQQYTHALNTLDSLLIGSNRWSRMMEKSSRLTGDIQRIWLNGWKPEGGKIRVDGFALSRSRVASLARQLNARIDRLEYAEVETEGGDVRVYPFTVLAPVPEDTPRVAQYLQEVAAGNIWEGDGDWKKVNAPTEEHTHPHR